MNLKHFVRVLLKTTKRYQHTNNQPPRPYFPPHPPQPIFPAGMRMPPQQMYPQNIPPPFDLPLPPQYQDIGSYEKKQREKEAFDKSFKRPKLFYLVLGAFVVYEALFAIIFFNATLSIDEEIHKLRGKNHIYTEQELLDIQELIEYFLFFLANGYYHEKLCNENFVTSIINLFNNVLNICGIESEQMHNVALLLESLALSDFEQFSIDLAKCGAPNILLEKLITLQKDLEEKIGTSPFQQESKPNDSDMAWENIGYIAKALLVLHERPDIHDMIIEDSDYIKTIQIGIASKYPYISALCLELVQKTLQAEVKDILGPKQFDSHLIENRRFISKFTETMKHQKNFFKNSNIEQHTENNIKKIDELLKLYNDEISGTSENLIFELDIEFWLRMLSYSFLAYLYVTFRNRFEQGHIPPKALRVKRAIAVQYVIYSMFWMEYGQEFTRKRINKMFEIQKGRDRVAIELPIAHYVMNRCANLIFSELPFIICYYRVKYLLLIALLTGHLSSIFE